MRLAPKPVGVFIFTSSSSMMLFHCRLHQQSPLPHPSPSFSPHTPAKSLFTLFHLSLGLPLLLPSTLSAAALFVNSSPSILPTRPAHFSPTLFHTNLLLQFLHSSLVYSFHPRNYSHIELYKSCCYARAKHISFQLPR